MPSLDEALHAADVERLEQHIMELALGCTGTRHGALFLWEPEAKGLVLSCLYVDGVVVSRPGTVIRRRKDGRPNGIAFHVYDSGEAYVCNDTANDPQYSRYFQDVGAIVAVPLMYQDHPFGVISVSALEPNAFGAGEVATLEELARSSSKFVRRAQLHRKKGGDGKRPFLIKGLSAEWLRVESQIERVAPTHAPVLVQGESGTGKELVAHAIHFNSRRAEKPFVSVNAAAIPEALLESMLFGHVRGAFTGAVADKLGEMQKADGGTLFLDEVGELPLALQAKVLRAIEDGEVQPVGSSKAATRVDVRIVCATNRDLLGMVRGGTFREDLYHRISVVALELPPLRSYKDNLEVLALIAMQQAARRHDKSVTRFAPEALAALRDYDYPGNVRELKNAVERGVVLAPKDEVRLEDLPRTITRAVKGASQAPPTAAEEKSLKQLREEWLTPLERRYLTDLLSRTDGDVKRAAEKAQVNMVTLYRLIKRRGIRLRRVAS
jgi:transcriptional regulator with GAF, ATPase, and Fis domain